MVLKRVLFPSVFNYKVYIMKKLFIAIFVALFASASFAAGEKDFVEICPKVAKVLFENESVRMLLLKQAKGQSCGIGFHRDHIDYHIKAVELKIGQADGTSMNIKIPEGASFRAEQGVYSFEVIGGQLELVIMEFK